MGQARSSPAVYRIPLRYHPDSSVVFEAIQHLPYPVFLDSGRPGSQYGRYDILCAAPRCRILTEQTTTWLINQQGQRRQLSGSPFEAIRTLLLEQGFAADQDQDLPFNGGALGYFSYDLGRSLEKLPQRSLADIDLPEMQVGIYCWAILVDHQAECSTLVYRHRRDSHQMQALAARLDATLTPSPTAAAPFRLSSAFTSNFSFADYRQRFLKVIDYIQAGDCYQVNLAQRFSAGYQGSSWEAYQLLRKQAPTPYSAFLSLPEADLLCLSPERFIQVSGLQVETKPIKGTRPRGRTDAEDARLKQALSLSAKDRAENLMIVDLLRNDLGRSCETGSVRVPKLFAVESYANVHHLVTTISGRLAQADDSLKLLEGSFPGGSITGAPKIRAMEIIEELEPHRRSAYCGSIGYIGFNGKVDTNICIRTLVAQRGRIHCWAGGGIVADSVCEEEYQETFDKVSNLIGPLEAAFLDPLFRAR